jgi:tetratricopeptide (TPR) repeat protein
VDILKAKHGAEAPGSLAAMLTLAGLYGDTGDHPKSVAMFEEVLKVQKAQRTDDAKVAETYRSIGLAQQRIGNAEAALPALEQAFKLAVGAYGNKHSLTVDLRKAVGRARCAVQKWEEGIPLLEQALQTELESRGADAPEVEAFRGEIGRAFESAGKTNQALVLYQAILDRRKEKFGADHRAVKAAQVDVYRVQYGPSHAETFGAMFDLGRSYRSTGQYEEAIAIYEKALETMKATRPPDDIGLLFELAMLGVFYVDTGQLEKALATHEEVIQTRLLSIQARPSEPIAYNEYLIYNLNMKQEILRRMGRYEEALAAHDEALKWAKKLLAPDSPHYRLIGSITSESIGLHEKLFASRKAKLGIEHADSKAAISALITFCTDAGQPASAEKTLVAVAEELTARQTDFPPGSSKSDALVFYFYKLIQLYKLLEKPDKAAEWQAKLDALTAKPQ